jgi:serine/threonine protein kinase
MTVKPLSVSGSFGYSQAEDAELARVLDAYLAAVEAGRPPDVDALAAEHPAIADRLRACLASLQLVEATAERLAAAQAGEDLAAPQAGFLGDFRIIREVGRGGMGIVYEAEQVSLSRRVALKVLPFAATMDPRHLQRFQNEARSAASLEHPHIVPVYGVGCERAVHYYAMKFIEGQSLAQVIDGLRRNDESQMTNDERMTNNESRKSAPEVPECKAGTQVRHSTLDILSSFVIGHSSFSRRDSSFFRTVAEWGIQAAEALEHAHSLGIVHRDIKPANLMIDGNGSLWITDFGLARTATDAGLTMTGDVLGTLRYMSPEQALAKHGLVDHRTDVYSLGVTLYELLTGRPAVNGKDREEILNAITLHEPRHPRALDAAIPQDLETIILRSLEKNPADRYAAAREMADDLRRFLEDKPIRARRSGMSRRAAKVVRRHPGVTATTAIGALIVLVLLVVGLWANNIMIRREQVRTQSALDAEAAQRALAEANENEAQAQKKQAIEFRNKALDALRATTGVDVERLIASKKELGANERAYLEAIAKRWQAFAAHEGTDQETRALRAEGHARVADLWIRLGRRDDALVEYEKAREIRQELAKGFPAVPEYQSDLAETHYNVAIVLRAKGRREEALAESTKGLVIQQELAKQFSSVPVYRQALATSHNSQGAILLDLRKHDEAISELRKSRDILKDLAAQSPNDPNYSLHLAAAGGNLGLVLSNLGKHDEARIEFANARDAFEKLTKRFSDFPRHQQLLTQTHYNLGKLLAESGKRDEALIAYRQAREVWQNLSERFPAARNYGRDLAISCDTLGSLLTDLCKWDEAQTEFERALKIRQKLAEEFPTEPVYKVQLGGTYCNFGRLVRDRGKPSESLPWFAKGIETLTPVRDKDAFDGTSHWFLRNCYSNRAVALRQLHQYAEAVQDLDRAIELSPKTDQMRFRLARATSRLQLGDVPKAIAEVVQLTKEVGDAHQWYSIACFYAIAAGELAGNGQEYADRAMELLQKAVQAGFRDLDLMAKDADLDPIREREDFKKLLKELQESLAKAKR